MTLPRAIAIVGCLLAGHAISGALFWALVNVPESNVVMLALSAAIVVALAFALSWTETTAVLAWNPDVTLGRAARRGLMSIVPFVASALVFWIFWWLTSRADAWHTAHSGEIDAWWMTQTGSAQTGWIHAAAAILLWLLRYLVGVSLAVGALSAGAVHGVRALASLTWVRRGLSARQIGPMGLAIVALIALPLRLVYWRPESIPPTALEVAFVTAKLSALALVVTIGWALVLRAGARAISAPSSPSPS